MTHEFEGESYSGPTGNFEAHTTGAAYDGYPLRLMTVENLLEVKEQKQYTLFVWPHEGRFTKGGKWKFHGGKVMDGTTEIDCPSQPLGVDMQSANAFSLVWNAINDKNKAKLREYVASRGLFCWAMQELVWPSVTRA